MPTWRRRSIAESAARSTRSTCRSRASKRPSSGRAGGPRWGGGSRRPPMGGGQRESIAERQARRAAIDDPAVVVEAAARFLEARPRSVAEVRRRLTQAGYRADLIETAIARFLELGVLDDAAFAAQWVESRDRANPRGEHALIIELRQKGIDATTIAATLRTRREAAVRWEDRAAEGPGHDAGSDAAAEVPPDLAAARKLLQQHARALDR